MKSQNFNIEDFMSINTKSLKDYLHMIRISQKSFVIILLSILLLSIAYALYAPNIYKSSVALKITEHHKNILQPSTTTYTDVDELNRFIANEIEIIKNFATRERVAKALIDTVENSKDKRIFSLLSLKKGEIGVNGHKTIEDIAELLKNVVSTDQKTGTDIVIISAESPSPKEAAIIANTYADQYRELNLKENRSQLDNIRKFLEKQSKEKLAELKNAENELANFKQRGGIIELNTQSNALISQLSQLDAERDATKIDLMASNEALNQYKKEINNQDPQLVNYLESQTSQAYIDALQKQIAELQMNRDMATANKNPNVDVSGKVKEYDRKINDLKEKLSSIISGIKTGAFSSSPDQVKVLTQNLIQEEVKNHSLSIKLNELQSIINNYESKLNKLPKKSMEYAGLERSAESSRQIYALVQQKYQEAMINELSKPGNVFIIGEGRIPDKPARPVRILYILIGFFVGFAAAFGYVLIKDYFNNKVKTPEDIQKQDYKLLAWIPQFKSKNKKGNSHNGVIVMEDPNSHASEAFKALRARLQITNSREGSAKTILISSAAQGEGKTMVATNLAYSLAQLRYRTLLIDCDLRRPKIHKVMNSGKTPGLSEYLMNKVAINEILKKSKLEFMRFITSGSSSADSTELFASKEMEKFLNAARSNFDYIILDSAPITAVIDSELLAQYVDGIVLVVSADNTEIRLMSEAVNIILNSKAQFLGTVLNNFKYKSGYSYYFRYYYNYPSNGKGEKKEKANV